MYMYFILTVLGKFNASVFYERVFLILKYVSTFYFATKVTNTRSKVEFYLTTCSHLVHSLSFMQNMIHIYVVFTCSTLYSFLNAANRCRYSRRICLLENSRRWQSKSGYTAEQCQVYSTVST